MIYQEQNGPVKVFQDNGITIREAAIEMRRADLIIEEEMDVAVDSPDLRCTVSQRYDLEDARVLMPARLTMKFKDANVPG